MGDPGDQLADWGRLSLTNDPLSPVCEEAADPSKRLSPDAVMVNLEEEWLMCYLVERLREVAQVSTRLTSLIKLSSQVINRQDQLGLARLWSIFHLVQVLVYLALQLYPILNEALNFSSSA